MLLDYNLPDLNGLEFLEQVAAGVRQAGAGRRHADRAGQRNAGGEGPQAGRAGLPGQGPFQSRGAPRHPDGDCQRHAATDRGGAASSGSKSFPRSGRACSRSFSNARPRSPKPIGARTSSSPPWRTSCAIRWPRSALPCRCWRPPGSTPARSRYLLDVLHRQVHHMVRLVDDLMEVSRITRGRVDLRMAKVDLAHVLHSALETVKPVLDAAGHRLEVSIPKAAMFWTAIRSARADLRQPAEQRREVHGTRAARSGSAWRRRATKPSFRYATTAAAFLPRCCPRCSTSSRKSTARSAARRAGSASGSPWPRSSRSCTAAASKCAATASTREANSSSACRFTIERRAAAPGARAGKRGRTGTQPRARGG